MSHLTAALEHAVLSVLPGKTPHCDFGDDFYHALNRIAQDAGIDKETARFACRLLRDKGLAQYGRGLFTEDGMGAGSGYKLTDAGRKKLLEG